MSETDERVYVDYECKDHIATIAMNRPEKLNAVSDEVVRQLMTAFRRFDADKDAYVAALPAVGAALVWVPVALYYLATGEIVSAIGLTLWGVLVIGLVDNLLRPMLVGKDTRLPDYVVMISTLGGMSVFGINGFVVGPAIAAMFIAAWHIWVPGSEPQD